MSFLGGLLDVIANTAQARVRVEAQKSARRKAGKTKDEGCVPCNANQKVLERYNANEKALRSKR